MKIKNFFKKNFWLILVVIAIGVHFAVSLRLAFFWYQNYNIGKFDLGNAAQVVYNTLRGDFFVYTNEFGARISRLSNHADFILLLFVPFFAVFDTPLVLVVAQCLALSIGGLIVYFLAQEFRFSKFSSFLFAGAYLLNVDVGYLALDAFHGITFAIPFVLLSFYFLERLAKFDERVRQGKKPGFKIGPKARLWGIDEHLLGFIISTFLVLISKENASLFVALLGLYTVFLKKQVKLGWALFSVGVLWFVGYFFFVSPAYGEARIQSAEMYMQQLGLGADIKVALKENPFLSRYSHLGDSLGDIITFPIRKPILFLSAALDWEYLQRILLSWGFLPLLAPLALILALPQYLINVLSQGAFMTHRHYGVLHYISLIIPIAAYAAVLGARRVKSFLKKQDHKFGYLPALTVFVFAAFVSWNAENPVVVNPIVLGKSNLLPAFRQWAEQKELERLAVLLGGDEGAPKQAKDSSPSEDSASDENSDDSTKTTKTVSRTTKPRKAAKVYILNPRHGGGYDLVFEYLEGKTGSISGPNALGAKLVLRDDYNLFPLRWQDSRYVVADLSGPPKFAGGSDKSISQFLRRILWDLEESSSFGVSLSGNGMVVFEKGLSDSLYGEMELLSSKEYDWESRGIIVRNFSAPDEVNAGDTFSFELGWECASTEEDSCAGSIGSMPFIALVPNGKQFASFYDPVYGIFLPIGENVQLTRVEQALHIPQNIEPGNYKICLGWYELIPNEMSGSVKLKDAVELGRITVR